MEYAKTKNILHVMNMLGHKNIQNTLVYTHLVNFESDEFHTDVANNVEDARKLIEAGFEYVTGEYGDGGKIFRKRTCQTKNPRFVCVHGISIQPTRL
jgi:hypothetical protein